MLGGIAAWYILWLSTGDALLPVRWAAYGAPWLALFATLAGAMLALQRSWSGAALAVVVAGLILLPVMPRLNPARWLATPAAANLTVMTFNTSDMNHDYDAIAASIVRARPDVILLQQIASLSGLQAALARAAKSSTYFSCPDRMSDTVILSSLPLSECHSYERGAMASAVATLAGHAVRLWDLHAPHGQVAMGEQEHFFLLAGQYAAAERLPIIMGGDLNSTEYNAVQTPLRDQVQDAYDKAGAGFGFTFPSRVRRFGTFGRLFRIDHIFFRAAPGIALTPLAAATGDNANSDHFPVVAAFRLSPAALPR